MKGFVRITMWALAIVSAIGAVGGGLILASGVYKTDELWSPYMKMVVGWAIVNAVSFLSINRHISTNTALEGSGQEFWRMISLIAFGFGQTAYCWRFLRRRSGAHQT